MTHPNLHAAKKIIGTFHLGVTSGNAFDVLYMGARSVKIGFGLSLEAELLANIF